MKHISRVVEQKKGTLTMNYVAIAVLIGVVSLIGIAFYIQYKVALTENQADQECKIQIKTHATIQRLTQETFVTSISCPTNQVVLDSPTNKEASEAIAKQMARCWDLWGEGKYDLFADEDAIFCHVCATVETGLPSVRELGTYLATHNITKNETYLEYLTGYSSGELFEQRNAQTMDSFYMNTYGVPVGIIFYYEKGKTVAQRVQDYTVGNPWVGAGAGLLTGVVALKAFPVSVPLIAAGSITGSTATLGAGIALFEGRTDASYLAYVEAVPLREETIARLGCTSAPVEP